MADNAQARNELNSGYVYILTCSDVPGVIKIGSTLRDPGKHVQDRFGTVEPVPCDVDFAVHVPNRHIVEKNLALKFAQARLPQEENAYGIDAEEAILAIVQMVGYDYTNAQITGVIFRKHVETIKKMESDFRSRYKNFRVLNNELGELQKQIRRYQTELGRKNQQIERHDAHVARLEAESALNAKECRKFRVAAYTSASVALIGILFMASSLIGLI